MSSSQREPPREPVIASGGQSRRFNVFGGEAVTPVIDSADVNGGYTIWIHEAASGVSPPRHVHHREDEVLHVLEGRLLIWCDGLTYEVGPGDTAALPKGLPHTWLVTSATPARLMATVVPGGLERFFTRMASIGAGHEALPDLARLMDEFGVEIIGPPLEAVGRPAEACRRARAGRGTGRTKHPPAEVYLLRGQR